MPLLIDYRLRPVPYTLTPFAAAEIARSFGPDDRAYLSALASETVESADPSRRCDHCDEVRPEAGGKSYAETWPCDVDGGDQTASWWICGECSAIKAPGACPCLERPADVGGLCAECRVDGGGT